jgi:hypothetical protein
MVSLGKGWNLMLGAVTFIAIDKFDFSTVQR